MKLQPSLVRSKADFSSHGKGNDRSQLISRWGYAVGGIIGS